MERLKHMKNCLISCVENQVSGNLHNVDAKELGEAIDMIKDLEEAIYYATITKAMKDKPEHYYASSSYDEPMKHHKYDDNWEERRPYMNMATSMGPDMNMEDGDYGMMGGMGAAHVRDEREGSSPMYRKMYLESRDIHHDKTKQMKDLENYAHELTNDIVEMIADATPEERQMLHQKICMLATKVK